MMRFTSRATRIAAAGAALGLVSIAGAATVETPITGLKLVLLDKYALGRAKLV
jgi:hypothetical protein